MDIWIIKNGEKVGPIPDYEIRGRLETGDLSLESPAWHEGLVAWRPLGEMPLFANENSGRGERRDVVKEAEEQAKKASPPSPADAHIARRFWARWLDLYGYAGLWWLAMWADGRNVEAMLDNSWVILSLYIPWFVIEAFLIHRFATTPGKWLLGIKVLNDDGSRLSLAQATLRASRVAFLGIGFGWGILALVCQLIALGTTLKLGRPLWDQSGQHHLQTARIGPFRIVMYVIVLFVALQLQMSVLGPYVTERMQTMYPELGWTLQKDHPWYLPKNH
jgi:uncharacterized RDD family membrane protein YckC